MSSSRTSRRGRDAGYLPLLRGLGIAIAASSVVLPHAVALDADEFARLERCKAIGEPAARLRCLDEFARKATQTPLGSEPASQAGANTAAGAGNGAANENDFGHEHWESTRETPDSIEATVVAVQTDTYGSLVLTLDNGQRWKQRGTERYRVDSGEKIIIQRGTMSSFFLRKAGGTRLVRFTRLQ